jgi:myo-inositol-1(or 4)-monophosphatase
MGSMPAAARLDPAEWVAAFGRAADAVAGGLRHARDGDDARAGLAEETGERGAGGDRTLVIDADAEDAVFAELERLHENGARFSALSEERGRVDFGGTDALVVIDPIDGSTNAKRGVAHHAVSLALATGPDVVTRGTMADVTCGLVLDLGSGVRHDAIRGGGARRDGEPLRGPATERRSDDGRIELVAIESADPRNLVAAGPALVQHAHRVRAIGAMALSLCWVADGRVDAMASLWRCRAIDVAAGQLIVRESGGHVAFGTDAEGDLLGAPLDLEPHLPISAARSPEGLLRAMALPAVADARS